MRICSVPECGRQVHALRLCQKHYRYQHARTDRIVAMGYRKPHRVRFTPELWDKWRARRVVDEHARLLRANIQLMRETLR